MMQNMIKNNCLDNISTPSLPIVGQNCWPPTNFQFFRWNWTSLPNVGADFTSQSCEPTKCLSGVL